MSGLRDGKPDEQLCSWGEFVMRPHPDMNDYCERLLVNVKSWDPLLPHADDDFLADLERRLKARQPVTVEDAERLLSIWSDIAPRFEM